MKLLTTFLSIGLLWFANMAAAQGQTCTADYSNVITIINSLVASLNVTNGIINSIPNVYMYTGYSSYWSDMYGSNLNSIGNNFAYMAGNVTSNLLAIFRNLSLAVNNTSANSNQSIFDLQTIISNTYIYVVPPSASDGYAGQLSTDISLQLNNLNSFINNLVINIFQLTSVGALPNAANILKIIPSPTLVQGLLQNLQNVTNVYIKYVISGAANLTNVYNVFKSSDPTLKAWDLVKNQTAYNWTLTTNNTQASLNATVVNFTRTTNQMFNSYVAQIPRVLKNYANFQPYLESSQTMLVAFNSSLQNLQDMMVPYFDGIRAQIETLDLTLQQNIMNMIRMYRQQIFANYQRNSTTLNCSIALLNTSEALWKAFGGPTNFFNCSTNENGLLAKLQPFLQSFLSPFYQDFNATLADFQKCLTIKNLTADNTIPYFYSMEQCLMHNGQTLPALVSSFGSLSGYFNQMVSGILSLANTRTYGCFKDMSYQLYGIYYPVVINYAYCIGNSTSGAAP